MWSAPWRGAAVFSDTLTGCGIIFRLLSGGLRKTTTTGYYLTAFQVEALTRRGSEHSSRHCRRRY
jgi:hypothetical protein